MTIHESLRAKRLEGFFCETVLTVEGQPSRDTTAMRVQRALNLGMRILSAPRAGSTRILTPDVYATTADESTRLERYATMSAAIEARGLGYARMSKVVRSEPKKFARAVAEWADGDSVAAHHSYANDLFCTQDRAVRAGRHSVLHPAHRGWFRRVYGVEFVTLSELAKRLERFD